MTNETSIFGDNEDWGGQTAKPTKEYQKGANIKDENYITARKQTAMRLVSAYMQ